MCKHSLSIEPVFLFGQCPVWNVETIVSAVPELWGQIPGLNISATTGITFQLWHEDDPSILSVSVSISQVLARMFEILGCVTVRTGWEIIRENRAILMSSICQRKVNCLYNKASVLMALSIAPPTDPILWASSMSSSVGTGVTSPPWGQLLNLIKKPQGTWTPLELG